MENQPLSPLAECTSFPHPHSLCGLEWFERQPSWFDGGFSTNARHYLVNLARIECNFAWSKSLRLELRVPLQRSAHPAIAEHREISSGLLMGVLGSLLKGWLLVRIQREQGRGFALQCPCISSCHPAAEQGTPQR